jgi:hypothetical protein
VRLALAIVSFVLSAAMLGLGIAQRTVLAGPDHITAAVSTTGTATVTVIDGTTLNSFERSQTVRISGAESIFAAYGRTPDVLAWVGDTTSYNSLAYDPETQQLVSTTVRGAETEVPDPRGSDLWLQEYTDKNSLAFTVDVPEDISVVIVSDGIEPAPSQVSVKWLLDNSTPFAGPLVLGGAILLLVGLGFLLWALNHMRRARGPRRKQPKLPKVPKKPVYKPVRRGSAQPQPIARGRRSARMVVAPVSVVLGALLLGACTDASGPAVNGSLTVAATAAPETDLELPAVTEAQAKRIIGRIAATIAEADAGNDKDLAATRLDGPALALRTANYAIRAVVSDHAAPPAIPATSVEIVLPQQNDSWPRTVLAVVQDPDVTIAPQTFVLIQDDPRSQYKVHYAVSLSPGTIFPKVPPASIGTSRTTADSKLFTAVPGQLAAAYGDTLMLDAASEFYELFETEGDGLRIAVGKADHDERISQLPSTATLSFSNAKGDGQTVVLVTVDGGAIVATELTETETITPVEVGAAVNAPSDVAALLGKALSTRGITARYSDQLLFYVPPATTGGPIVLLGYSQGLVSAVEL